MSRRGPVPRGRRAALSLAGLLLVTGTLHFAAPAPFDSIVPGFLGPPRPWTYASGVAELGCAAGLLVPRTRSAAGWACAVLFVAVFPANVQMAVDALRGNGSVPVALLRLPLQVPLVLWAVYVARAGREGNRTGRPGGRAGCDSHHRPGRAGHPARAEGPGAQPRASGLRGVRRRVLGAAAPHGVPPDP